MEADRRCDVRHPIAPALLTGRHRDASPVVQLPFGLLGIEAHDAAFRQDRNDTGRAELRGFLEDPVHALPAGHALGQGQNEGRLALHGARLMDAHPHRVLAEFLDRGAEFTATPIEYGERIAGSEAQDAHDVVGSGARDEYMLSRREVCLNVHACQAHVAFSMPSRATSTIRSISSGVIT